MVRKSLQRRREEKMKETMRGIFWLAVGISRNDFSPSESVKKNAGGKIRRSKDSGKNVTCATKLGTRGKSALVWTTAVGTRADIKGK